MLFLCVFLFSFLFISTSSKIYICCHFFYPLFLFYWSLRPFSGSRSTEILQRGAELLKLAASLLIFRPHRPVVAAAVAVVVVVVVVIIIVVPIRKQAPRRSSYDSAQHPPPADDSFLARCFLSRRTYPCFCGYWC